MAESMPARDARTELNKVQTRAAKVRTLQNSPVDPDEITNRADVLSLIEVSRRAAGLKLDYLATLDGNPSKGQLSGALNGTGGFNVRWMDSWPQVFWDEFLPRLRGEREDSPEARRLRKVERLKLAINDLIDIVDEAAP